ncbi:MAG: hypothetical protein ABSC72_03650 [Methylovirgula sp.]|jgi:hypothetical protein
MAFSKLSPQAPEVRGLRRLCILLGCVCLVLIGSLGWLLVPQIWRTNQKSQGQPDEDIVFSNKLFVNTKDFVAVEGTLTGDWIAYKNNTYSFLCFPKECLVAFIEQIGARQVGRTIGPTTYPVISWADDEVVASDDGLCSKTTITIDRNEQILLWVETPINQTTIACKNVDDGIRKATIEPSLFWRR